MIDQREYCIICGKEIKGKVRWWVHMNTRNEVIPMDQKVSMEENMGAFLIGSECAKKYPGLAEKDTQS